tara:strand:+ start:469 stop:861 length:393 start_codon:yes stop_codon:yes gene_type:complete
MKNSKFIMLNYLYYLSLVVLIIVYLFPGSLIGYFLYGNFEKQPDLILNPIGTSINHLIYFLWLTILSFLINSKDYNLFNNLYFLFILSIGLELLHLFIPNRAFEYYDLIANISGIIIGLIIYKIFLWLKK